MFRKEKKINDLSLSNIKDIPIILNNINNKIIIEKFIDLNIYAFREFSIDQIFYVAKYCNCKEVRKMAIKEIIFTSKGNEHFEYLKKLNDEIIDTNEVISKNINKVLDTNMTQSLYSDKKYNIISYIDENIIFKNINSIDYLQTFNELDKVIKDRDSYYDALKNNFANIILNCNNIGELLNFFKTSNFVNSHKYLLDENIDLITSKILITSVDILKNEDLLLLYKLLIKDILEHENISINDVQYIDRGSYCYVYKFGNLAVKFGRFINCRDIPKHPRILKPIIRPLISNSDRYIEVQYLADTGNFSIDDAYEIYKELRDDGIICVDCKPSNLGRLTMDNINGYQDIQASDKAVGFINDENNNDERILHIGDTVIIDNDLIFYEKDFNIEKIKKLNVDLRLYYYFEDRYQKDSMIKRR